MTERKYSRSVSSRSKATRNDISIPTRVFGRAHYNTADLHIRVAIACFVLVPGRIGRSAKKLRTRHLTRGPRAL